MNNILSICKKYSKSSNNKAFISLFNTFIAQLIITSIIYLGYNKLGWFLNSLNMVRIFIQFHDMAHYSFFQNKYLNEFIGWIFGVYMFCPFISWRDGHNQHHRDFGNLDGHDDSQTILFTKKEYESYPIHKKILMRLFREPIIFFFVSSIFTWIFYDLFSSVKKYKIFSKVILSKLLSFIFYIFIAPKELFVSFYLAIVMGFILFHLQHSVNDPYRKHEIDWNKNEASLFGSTLLKIPYFLKFFTNGIEYHHLHHLNTRIPSYYLKECHEKIGEKYLLEYGVNKVSYLKSFYSLWNVMLDEENNEFVYF